MAIQHGHTDLIQELLDRGTNLSAQDDNGCTPLHLACAAGDVAAAATMGKRTHLTIMDNQGLTPLGVAVKFGHLEVMHVLVDLLMKLTNVTLDCCTVLHVAAQSQETAVVDYLLQGNCVDVNAVDKSFSTALHYAVQEMDQSRESLDIYDRMPNSWSDPATAAKYRLRVLTLLLAVNNINANAENDKGKTPLMVALSSRYHQAAAKLITSGVNVNIPDHQGQTALSVAIEQDNITLVRLLLKHGARTDIADAKGRTPISIAASADIRLVGMFVNSQEYHERCFAFLSNQTALPTSRQLQELTPLITSVYDLRFMLTLGTLCEEDMATKRMLLKDAFHHVTGNQLVYDEDAIMFFRQLLKHCECEKLITQRGCEAFNSKMETIDNANANCVAELKKQFISRVGDWMHMNTITNPSLRLSSKSMNWFWTIDKP